IPAPRFVIHAPALPSASAPLTRSAQSGSRPAASAFTESSAAPCDHKAGVLHDPPAGRVDVHTTPPVAYATSARPSESVAQATAVTSSTLATVEGDPNVEPPSVLSRTVTS